MRCAATVTHLTNYPAVLAIMRYIIYHHNHASSQGRYEGNVAVEDKIRYVLEKWSEWGNSPRIYGPNLVWHGLH